MFAGTSKCLRHVTAQYKLVPAVPRLSCVDLSLFQDLNSIRFFNEGARRRSMAVPMPTQEGVTNYYGTEFLISETLND